MTKKHFNKLAYALAMIEPTNVFEKMVWCSCIYAVADVCKAHNSRFDYEKFIEACHFDYWKTHKIPR